jgi:hypothetical protein
MKNILIIAVILISFSSCTSVKMAFGKKYKETRREIRRMTNHTTPTVYHNIDGCKYCQREINYMLNVKH